MSFNIFRSLHNLKLIKKIEAISFAKNDRIARLKGFIRKGEIKEDIEIIIFKGFTSSTTHPTEWDMDKETIPNNTIFEKGEILKAPLNPYMEEIVLSSNNPNELTNIKNWK